MILVCGIPSETPLRMVTSNLEKIGAQFILLNQREFPKCQLWFEVKGGEITGELQVAERTCRRSFPRTYLLCRADGCTRHSSESG